MILLGKRCPNCGEHSGVSYLRKCFSKPSQVYICSNCGSGLILNWPAFFTILFGCVTMFWVMVVVFQLSVLIAWAVSSMTLLILWLSLSFKLPTIH